VKLAETSRNSDAKESSLSCSDNKIENESGPLRSIRKKIRNSLILLRQGKIDQLLDAIAWSVPHRLFFYHHSILIKTDHPNWNPRPQPGMNIRQVMPDDIGALEKDGFTDKKLLTRLEAGDRGVLMEQGDEIMTIVWGSRGRRFLTLSGAVFDPGEDGFFFYGAYTNTIARNQGLFYNVAEYIHKAYYADNIRWTWGAISASNSAWLNKLLERMNFTRAGETYYIKLLFLNICYYKSWPHPTRKIHLFLRVPPDNLKCV